MGGPAEILLRLTTLSASPGKANPRSPLWKPCADEVLSAWRADKQVEAYSAYLARLREKYGVRFDDGVKALLEEPPVERRAAK